MALNPNDPVVKALLNHANRIATALEQNVQLSRAIYKQQREMMGQDPSIPPVQQQRGVTTRKRGPLELDPDIDQKG